MNHWTSSLLIVVATVLLGGCATSMSPTQMVASQRIEPYQQLQHGATDLQAHYALGKYHLGAGRFVLAREEFLRALSLDSRSAEARNGLASAYVQLGETDHAVEQLTIAVAASPEASHLQSNLGYALYLKGNYRESARALTRAITLDPENQKARQNWVALQARVSGDDPPVAAAPDALSTVTASRDGVPTNALLIPIVAVAAPVQTTSSFQHVINIDFDRPAAGPVYTVRFDSGIVATSVASVAPTEAGPAEPYPTVASVDMAQSPKLAAPVGPRSRQESKALPTSSAVSEVQVRRVSLRQDDRPTGVQEMALARGTRIEVSNGNGVSRMAARVSLQLVSLDLKVARVTNADRFSYETTRIYVREGHAAEAAALGRMLPITPEIVVFPGHQLPAKIDVRIVIGRDFSSSAQIDLIHRDLPAPVTFHFGPASDFETL